MRSYITCHRGVRVCYVLEPVNGTGLLKCRTVLRLSSTHQHATDDVVLTGNVVVLQTVTADIDCLFVCRHTAKMNHDALIVDRQWPLPATSRIISLKFDEHKQQVRCIRKSNLRMADVAHLLERKIMNIRNKCNLS